MVQWIKDPVFTAAARVAAVVQVASLAQELPHATGVAKKPPKTKDSSIFQNVTGRTAQNLTQQLFINTFKMP